MHLECGYLRYTVQEMPSEQGARCSNTSILDSNDDDDDGGWVILNEVYAVPAHPKTEQLPTSYGLSANKEWHSL